VEPNGQSVTFAFDAGGRLIERSLGSGLTTQYNWMAEGSLDSIIHLAQAGASAGFAGNVQTAQLAKHAYTYDIWGNRSTSSDVLSGTTYANSYGYDALSRLKSVSPSNNGTSQPAQDEGYSFDIFGNRTGKTLGNPVSKSWIYNVDDAHQLTQVQQTTGSTTVTTALMRYDANGNLKKLCEAGSGSVADAAGGTDCTASGTGSSVSAMSWSGLDELVALAKAGTGALSEAYAYDEAGRRIKKTSGSSTNHYLYNGEDILAEWSGASLSGAPAAVYAHGMGTDDPMLRLSGASGTPDAVVTAYGQDGIGNASVSLDVSAVMNGTASAANQSRVVGSTLVTTGDYNSTVYPSSQLKDGVTTFGTTAGSPPAGWVGKTASGAAATVTLPSATTVEHVELMAMFDYLPSSYVVEVKNLDGTWRQVASGTNADFTQYDAYSVRAVKSFAATSTSGVRIRFTAAVNSGLVSRGRPSAADLRALC
jgi:hypothetical protein